MNYAAADYQKRIQNKAGKGIIEEANTATKHALMGDTKGLPGKAESRQPQYIVRGGEAFLLVD